LECEDGDVDFVEETQAEEFAASVLVTPDFSHVEQIRKYLPILVVVINK